MKGRLWRAQGVRVWPNNMPPRPVLQSHRLAANPDVSALRPSARRCSMQLERVPPTCAALIASISKSLPGRRRTEALRGGSAPGIVRARPCSLPSQKPTPCGKRSMHCAATLISVVIRRRLAWQNRKQPGSFPGLRQRILVQQPKRAVPAEPRTVLGLSRVCLRAWVSQKEDDGFGGGGERAGSRGLRPFFS